MKVTRVLPVFAAALLFAMGVWAQEYPAKPVKVIVPYTQGSATDVLAHMVCGKLSELWGQPVVIENRPGAGGTIGAAEVAGSMPDGYTLLVHSSSYAVSQATYARPPYSMMDFVDIAPFARQPYALVVGPTANVENIGELIAMAKARPGAMKYGSAGTGSSTHLVAERFASAAGIDVVHVPYKGGPEANAATADGTVTYWFPPLAIALKGIANGKLIGLGVTSAGRSALLPDVPTLAEAGIVGFEANVWWGMWAPAGIPASVQDKLTKDVGRALATSELRAALNQKGFEPMSMTSQAFRQLVEAEVKSAARTLKEAGIEPR
jgi:tripartite-type tricarboxylate transporter receptor subunit TctC